MCLFVPAAAPGFLSHLTITSPSAQFTVAHTVALYSLVVRVLAVSSTLSAPFLNLLFVLFSVRFSPGAAISALLEQLCMSHCSE